MAISLTPELNHLVDQKLATGHYKTVEDVLLSAMRALDEQDETIAAIAEGLDDMPAGRIFSLEEANAEFRRKYGGPPQPQRGVIQ